MKLDALLTRAGPNDSNLPRQLVGALNQSLDPQEVLGARLELVRGVDLQPLPENEHPDDLAGLLDRALSVLTRHHARDLEGRPFPVESRPKRVEQERLLPIVEDEVGPLQNTPDLVLKLLT
jgi:hypothetical protein